MSPPLNDPNLPTFAAFVTRMLVLPNGQVLFNDGLGNQLYAYTPRGSANHAYLPVIERVQRGEDGVFTLTGRQLNGPSDASAYGDDAQSNENFPVIRLQNSSGLVFYCRSTDWTSTDVGNIPHESVKFTLNPARHARCLSTGRERRRRFLFPGSDPHYPGRSESSLEPGLVDVIAPGLPRRTRQRVDGNAGRSDRQCSDWGHG